MHMYVIDSALLLSITENMELRSELRTERAQSASLRKRLGSAGTYNDIINANLSPPNSSPSSLSPPLVQSLFSTYRTRLTLSLIIHSVKRPVQTGNVSRLNTNKHYLVTKHFTVWPPCFVQFDPVWSRLIKFEGHEKFDQTA